MRISPATAKFKVPAAGGPDDQGFSDQSSQQLPDPNQGMNGLDGSVATSRSTSSFGSSASIPTMTSSTTASSVSNGYPQSSGIAQATTLDALAQLIAKANVDPKQIGSNRSLPSITAPLVQDQQKLDESWKHQEQARAILGNLIGPNGEQLTSTDPYNTTVRLFPLPCVSQTDSGQIGLCRWLVSFNLRRNAADFLRPLRRYPLRACCLLDLLLSKSNVILF